MINVDVWTTAIIVGHKTGVTYGVQCGGTCCVWNTLEGFVIPYRFGLDKWEEELTDYFCGHPWHSCCSGNLREEDADFIDRMLSEPYAVDRARLKESMESWVYIRPAGGGTGFEGIADGPMVLTWPNSD